MDKRHNANKNIDASVTAKKKINTRKPPIVKQTLTSLYRIAKANPLLLLANDNKAENDFGLNNIKLPKSLLLPVFNQTNSENSIPERKILTRATSSKSHSGNPTYKKSHSVQTSTSTKTSLATKRPLSKLETKDVSQPKRMKLTDVKELKKDNKPIKRVSLSTKYFERKKGLNRI